FSRERNNCGCSTMEVSFGDNNFSFVFRNALYNICPFSGDFDSGFNSFGTTVHRQDHLVSSQISQFFVKKTQFIIAESTGSQTNFVGLVDACLDNARVTVTLVDGGVCAQAVEVAFTIDIGYPGTFPII